MELKDKIKSIYLSNKDVQEKLITIVLKNLDKDYSSFLQSTFYRKVTEFNYYYFVENKLEIAKQALYTAGKCEEYNNMHFQKSNANTIKAFYYLLSDSKEIIDSFKDWQFNNQELWLKQGALIFVIQEILKDNRDRALELLQVFENKHKKYALKEQDVAILRAIINKDKNEVEELLEFFLLPKNHKKCNDNLFSDYDLYSLHATGFAKLAWIKGIEVEIDHPLLPKELLPIKPNKEYKIEYEFLQPDYKPNVKTVKEVPRQNAKYRNDKPKNKIGITKELLANLIKQNWKATYTEQELQKNVNLIYLAFTNPQEFDKHHYDIGKMANMHIASRDKDHIYIESKPFTSLWTATKGKEMNYFIDTLELCFDVLGIEHLTEEQHTALKKQLEEKQNKNKGFFGKWFN